ncbi:MAG TPA: hypothetical protein ENJ56_04190 [Anaerolineae bacterium]|nr:hypothetical protein [Anaerolineae bacterium]
MPINPPDTPVYIGSCQFSSSGTFPVGCQGLSPDVRADSVLYTDGRGLWRGTFDGFAPTLLADYSLSGALVYDPIAWSADGRYLLMWGGYIEGGQRFVYDSLTERVTPVPFSSSYIFISAVSWLQDNQLLVLSPSDPSTGQRPVASVFTVDGDSDAFLTLERDITIPTVGVYERGQNNFPGVQIWSPPSYDGQQGPFAIVSTDDRESGVYLINLNNSEVKRLNGLPKIGHNQFLREVVWAPDGESVLLVYSLGELTNQVFWISADADTPTALPLSESICCVQWK